MVTALEKLFRPDNVVIVIGSLAPTHSYVQLVHNSKTTGYQGLISLVSTQKKFAGYDTVADFNSVEGPIDSLIFICPLEEVPTYLKQAGILVIKAALILSGRETLSLSYYQSIENEIRILAKKYDIRIVGSQSFGIQTPDLELNLSLYNKTLKEGNIALITQSKSIATMIGEWAYYENFGFSYFISIGSQIDIKYHHLIDFLSEDFHTQCILIYMETLSEARKFMSASRQFARKKPIVIFKTGKTPIGAEIVYSNRLMHSGLADKYSAAFSRVGIIEVNTLLQLFNSAEAFGKQKRPKGQKLAIVSNSAASAIVAADKLIEHGGQLSEFSEITKHKLGTISSSNNNIENPIDLRSGASVTDYKKTLLSCIHDQDTDAILVIYSPTDPDIENELANSIVRIAKSTEKTILVCWISRRDKTKSKLILENGGLPVYHFPENAIKIFILMYEYAKNIELLYETPLALPQEFSRDKNAAKQIIENAIVESRDYLMEEEAQKLLGHYGLNAPQNSFVSTIEQAVDAANHIGFPVVLKIANLNIQNKIELGGVQLNLSNDAAVRSAFETILKNTRKGNMHTTSVVMIVEKMIISDYELHISAETDSVLGPVIKFGLGGPWADVFEDFAYGLPPLNMALAQRIIEKTKVYRLFKGYKGSKKIDHNRVNFLLYKFSYLLVDFPQIIHISINPLALNEKDAYVLHTQIGIDTKKDSFSDYGHLVISPSPEHYIKEVELKNGVGLKLRPIQPEDELLEQELIKNLSDQSLYYRFFNTGFKIDHQMLSRFTNIDYDREVAIGAEYNDGKNKHLAGVVRLVIDIDANRAEYAIAIRDDWHGMGLGGKLTDFIIDIAKKRQLDQLHATLLAANNPMLRLFKSRNFEHWEIDEETIGVKLNL